MYHAPAHYPDSPPSVVEGEHKQKALPRAHVLFPHGAKFLLPRRVQDCRGRKHTHTLGLVHSGPHTHQLTQPAPHWSS